MTTFNRSRSATIVGALLPRSTVMPRQVIHGCDQVTRPSHWLVVVSGNTAFHFMEPAAASEAGNPRNSAVSFRGVCPEIDSSDARQERRVGPGCSGPGICVASTRPIQQCGSVVLRMQGRCSLDTWSWHVVLHLTLQSFRQLVHSLWSAATAVRWQISSCFHSWAVRKLRY